MVICPICETENEDKSIFCSNDLCFGELNVDYSDLRITVFKGKYQNIQEIKKLLESKLNEIEELKEKQKNIYQDIELNKNENKKLSSLLDSLVSQSVKGVLESIKTNMYHKNHNEPVLKREQFETIEEFDEKINNNDIIEAGSIKLLNYDIEEKTYYFEVHFLSWLEKLPNLIGNKIKISRAMAKILYNKSLEHTLYS